MRLWERRAGEAGLAVDVPPDRRKRHWCIHVPPGTTWPDMGRTQSVDGEVLLSGLSWDDAYDQLIVMREAAEILAS